MTRNQNSTLGSVVPYLGNVFMNWLVGLYTTDIFRRPLVFLHTYCTPDISTFILRDPASHSHALPLDGAGRVKEEAGWQLGVVNQVEDFYVSPLSAATCFFATWLSASMLHIMHNRPFSTNITTAIIDQLSHLHRHWAIETLGLKKNQGNQKN